MNLNSILLIAIAIFALIILIKILSKSIFKIIATITIILGLGLYLFFTLGNNVEDIKFKDILTSYTVNDLKTVYCNENANEISKIKCDCIISPIINDLEHRFSKLELDQLQKSRIKFAYELLKSLNNKKTEIYKKLKDKDALYLFKEFKSELINIKNNE